MPNLEDKIVSNIAVYLDESAQNVPSYLYAKQYDANSRYINVKLMTSSGQYRVTGACQLNAVKPNGAHVYISGANNPDGTVTFGLTSNMLTDIGNVACDISIFDEDDSSQVLLTSSTFFVVVDKSNYDADAIEGSDEFSTVTEALAQIAADKAAAEAAAEDAREIADGLEDTLATKADGLKLVGSTLSLTADGEEIEGSSVQIVTDLSSVYAAIAQKANSTDVTSGLATKADGLELTNNMLYLLSGNQRITAGVQVTTDLTAVYNAISQKADGLRVVGNTLQLTSNGVLIGDAVTLPQSIADVDIDENNKVFLVDDDGHQIGEGFTLPAHASDVTKVTDGEDTKLYLTDENGEIMGNGVTLPAGGGGGGGGTGSSTLSVTRITQSPIIATQSDAVVLRYRYSSVDPEGDDVDGSFVWKLGNSIIASGTVVQGINSFDVSNYLTVGTQKFTLTVTDATGNVAAKAWTVQVVNIRIESSFNDAITYEVGHTVNFSYTPYGSVAKTIHFILDGVELPSVNTGSSGILSSYTLPAQEHGAHMLECYITADINGTVVETEHLYKDIVWYDPSSSVPVIGCIYRCIPVLDGAEYDENTAYYSLSDGIYSLYTDGEDGWDDRPQLYYQHIVNKQYNPTVIPYYVFDPNTAAPTVIRSADGDTLSSETMTSSEGSWSYRTSVIGLHTLALSCRSTTIGIIVQIDELGIDVNPVGGTAFDFSPEGLSNTSENRLWTDANNPNVHMTVSDNFDWNNGGYQIDEDGNQYFCIKAGTTASFSYNLYAKDAATYGSEFKIIFKTTNVKNVAATFMNATAGATPVGLKMNVHEAYFYSSVSSLHMPYSEEDIIELELNINAIGQSGVAEQGLIMSYEDGVAMRPMIYDATHRVYQYTNDAVPITIGSADCDVHIYRMKAYENALSDSDILTNFIADSRDADTMLSRYNRNQIYNENNVLTPESLSEACPQLRIIKIECPHFTNDKKDYVKGTNVECLYKGGDAVLDNWKFTNAYHAGQGTTSNEYGYSGRNIDVICSFDGLHDPTGKIKNLDPTYKTILTLGDGTRFDDGTGKISITRDSVPNNWFNIRVKCLPLYTVMYIASRSRKLEG